MGDLMQLQHMIISERFAANIASVRFFTGMRSRMHFELFRAGEPFIAAFANVRFFAGMGSQMNNQLPTLDESLGTVGAFVRAFACVYPHMSVKFTRMFKSSFADVTLVGSFFGMDTRMHAQVLLDRKRFLAVFALVGFFTSVGSIVAR